MACNLYCCLMPQREALRTCRSGFPIATLLWNYLDHSAAVTDQKLRIRES